MVEQTTSLIQEYLKRLENAYYAAHQSPVLPRKRITKLLPASAALTFSVPAVVFLLHGVPYEVGYDLDTLKKAIHV